MKIIYPLKKVGLIKNNLTRRILIVVCYPLMVIFNLVTAGLLPVIKTLFRSLVLAVFHFCHSVKTLNESFLLRWQYPLDMEKVCPVCGCWDFEVFEDLCICVNCDAEITMKT